MTNSPSSTKIPDVSDDRNTLQVTLIRSENPLTKSYCIGADGEPMKNTDPFLVSGTASRLRINTNEFAADFPVLLAALAENECLVLGALSADIDGDTADITTKKLHAPHEAGDGSPVIWRGKAWLNYRAGMPAVLGIDHDAKDIPADMRERLEADGGLLAVLQATCPAMLTAACVTRPSVSTGIAVATSGKSTIGGGKHIYIPVQDGADAQRFIGLLHDRLVLAGWGFTFVSEAGGIFVRSLIDTAASGVGERLWFEASARFCGGLAYETAARLPVAQSGEPLDTATALAPLTAEESALLREVEAGLHGGAAEDANQKRLARGQRLRAGFKKFGEDGRAAE